MLDAMPLSFANAEDADDDAAAAESDVPVPEAS